MKGFLDLIRNILYRYDIEIAEFQSIWAKVLVGVGLLVGLSPKEDLAYTAISTASNLSLLSTGIIIIGIVHTIGMVKDSINYRRLASLLACIVWSYITVVVGLKHGILALITSTFALSSALVYLRLTGILSRSQRREGTDGDVLAVSGISTERISGIPTRSLHNKAGEE